MWRNPNANLEEFQAELIINSYEFHHVTATLYDKETFVYSRFLATICICLLLKIDVSVFSLKPEVGVS